MSCTIFAYAAWAVAQSSSDTPGAKNHENPNTISGQPPIHNLKIAVMDLNGMILSDSTVVSRTSGDETKAETLSDGMHAVEVVG
ncbi:MAG: hypothetical protein IH804_03955, partial [Planctomycetes bacterium]|nr:hypothetical protein [Planctomycetota bacterium]